MQYINQRRQYFIDQSQIVPPPPPKFVFPEKYLETISPPFN